MKILYCLYKVTNLITGQFYIGVHSTSNINDSYFGSGNIIKQEIKKYGQEFFRKNILLSFEDKKTMYDMEEKIVSPYFLENFNTYNLIIGGRGISVDNKHYHKMSYEDYISKHGKDGYPEYDETITKFDKENRDEFLILIHKIVKNNGTLDDQNSNLKETNNYENDVPFRKRILTLFFFLQYYKKINFLNAKMLDDFEFTVNAKIAGFLRSSRVAQKLLSTNVPVSYVNDELFCDWFAQKLYDIYVNVRVDDFIESELLEPKSDLFNLIENIHSDHLKVLNNISSLRCIKSGKIKWLGENNYEILLSNIKPPAPKINKVFKKAKLGNWWE